jgi:ribosome-binding factor A
VTRVELAADLAHARIHVSVLGGEAAKRTTMRGLEDARGLIQNRIARRMRTRITPEVQILLDESIERTFRILDKIKEARATDRDHVHPEVTAGGPEQSDKQGAEELENRERAPGKKDLGRRE